MSLEAEPAAPRTAKTPLTEAERAAWDANGFAGPFFLHSPEQAETLGRAIHADADEVPGLLGVPRQKPGLRVLDTARSLASGGKIPAAMVGMIDRFPWFKSAQSVLHRVHEMASDPRILDRVESLLGPDILLWSAQIIERRPGQVHQWHVDVEHTFWEGVSVWIGLNHVTPESSLLAIAGSQRAGVLPQEIPGLDRSDDSAVLKAASGKTPDARVEVLGCVSGQFVIFGGRTWHASRNTLGAPRTALLLQYARPDAKVRAPTSYGVKPDWHPSQPPVSLVRGEDRQQQNIVAVAPPKRAEKLSGKVALVTGAGRGIGRAIAERLIAEGARVALVSRTRAELETVAQVCGGGHPFTADVTDEAAVDKLVSEVESQLGPIDLLVNDAGTFRALGPSWELDPQLWKRDLDTSIFGTFLCSRAVLRSMVARKQGRIVNLIGGGVSESIPFGSAYSVAKTGVMRLTEGLAVEAAPFGVQVFALNPGLVHTSLTAGLARSEAGKKFRPQLGKSLDEGNDVSPTRAARLVVELAAGRFDRLSGRAVAVSDQSFEALEKEQARIVATDRSSLRMREKPRLREAARDLRDALVSALRRFASRYI